MNLTLVAGARADLRVPAMHAGLPLALRNVRVAYEEPDRAPRVVLDIPALDIAGGEQVAVCGPSGSGKTTLLNVMAGIERAQRGTARWGAVDVAAMSPRAGDRWRRATLGLVFQQFHLFPGLSASELQKGHSATGARVRTKKRTSGLSGGAMKPSIRTGLPESAFDLADSSSPSTPSLR
jgi:ABC-type lipoprotein export system ATPase subunit